jgi:hypothetical protein
MMGFNKKPEPTFMSKLLSFCGTVIIIAGAVVLGIMALNYIVSAGAAAASLVIAGGAALASMFSADPTVTEKQVKSDKFSKAG